MKRHLLNISLAAAMLLAGAFLAFYLYQNVREQALSQFNESHLLIARQAAEHIELYFDARSQDVRDLASHTSLQHLDAKTMPADVRATFTRLETAYVRNIVVLDATGQVVYAAADGAIGLDNTGSDIEAWARRPANKGTVRLVVEKPATPVAATTGEGLTSHTPRLFLVTPIYQESGAGGVPGDGGTFAGMLLLTVDLRTLAEGTLGPKPTESLYPLRIWVMDAEGTLLLQSDHPEMVLKSIRGAPGECTRCHVSFDYAEQMLTAKQGTLEYQLKGQPTKVAAFAPMSVAGVSWVVVVNAPRDDITGFLWRTSIQTLGLFGVVGIVVGLSFLSVYTNARQEIVIAEKAKHLKEEERLVERLRESEAFLRQAQSLAKVGSWKWDTATNALQWSEELYRINRYDPTLPVPNFADMAPFYTPESWTRLNEVVTKALQTGEAFEVELDQVRTDGTVCRALSLGDVGRDASGRIVGLHGTVQDITERKQAEEALLAREAYLRASMNNVPYLMWLKDRNGTFLTVNDLFARSCGRQTAADVIGKTDMDVWPADLASKYRADDAEVMATRTQKRVEEPIATQGGVRWFETFKTPVFDASGESIGTTGIAQDITERVQTQKELKRLSMAVGASYEVIFVTDMEGVITSVNPAFTRLYGYPSAEIVGKVTPRILKSGAMPQEAYESFWKAMLGKQEVTSEFINRTRDGRLVTVESSANAILDEHGESIGFLAIQHDITERRQLEAEFRHAQKMESVGQLTSGIAHDFNNLLTVINGTAELLLGQVPQDDPKHADLQEISRAGERAATLTRQLLAFSRQQILEPQVLNFSTVVAGMESLLGRLLGEDIDLVVVRAPGVGHVKADPGQLEQVITNLVVNARDAMPQGGRLTLETENVEIDGTYARGHGEAVPPGSYVRLTVSDSGIGMDEATRARIFEPFFTTKGPGKGTGLGLSTVFGIVKQSRGFIWVYSEVGQGTSIQICLPRVSEAVGPDRAQPTVASSPGTETILLVEDNDGLRKLAARVLRPAGYTVLEAASGEEALAVLARCDAPVHLLLTDVVMPGMGGRELVERLAGTWPEVKVLYMSGYTSDTVVRHGVLDAQMPFVHKPFTAAALLEHVREVLDSQ